MTVPSEVNVSGPYAGNGVTTTFDYAFKVASDTHLQVLLKDVTTGVITVLSKGTDYNVSGVGNPVGGQVQLSDAPAVGKTLTVLLDVPFTQETVLENHGAYYAKSVEAAFDLATQRDLIISRDLARAMKLPFGETSVPLPSAAQRAGMLLAFDGNGDPVALSPVGMGQVPAPLSALGANVFAGATSIPTPIAATATLAKFYAGSLASPVTGVQPTVSISRYDASELSAGVYPSALFAEVIGHNTSAHGVSPLNAATFRATQNGDGDVLGLGIEVTGAGGNGFYAYAVFYNVWAKNNGNPGQAAFGIEGVITNDSVADPYTKGKAGVYFAQLNFAVGGGVGSHDVTAGVHFWQGVWNRRHDVGILGGVNSIRSALVWDDSSGTTSYVDTGNHTNGIDLRQATYSGSAILSTGFTVGNTGDVSARNLNLAGLGSVASILGVGSDANIALNIYGKGTGAVSVGSNGSITGLSVYAASSAVNYLSITGASTGSAPVMLAAGTDATIALSLQSKNTGDIYLGSATQGTSFSVTTPASTVNRLGVSGSVTTAAPSLNAIGTDTNISMSLVPKGNGRVLISGGATVASIIGGSGVAGTQLTFQTTTGSGTSDAFAWCRGNNGGTLAMTLNEKGLHVGLGTNSSANAGDITLGRSGTTGVMYFGSSGGAYMYYDGTKYDFAGGDINITTGDLKRGGIKVVGARDTGWAAMTGTADKATAFATSTVTLAQLAGRVMAMQAALTTHGLLGT